MMTFMAAQVMLVRYDLPVGLDKVRDVNFFTVVIPHFHPFRTRACRRSLLKFQVVRKPISTVTHGAGAFKDSTESDSTYVFVDLFHFLQEGRVILIVLVHYLVF